MKSDGKWKQIGFTIGTAQHEIDKTWVATIEFKVAGHEFALLVKGDFTSAEYAENAASSMLADDESEVSKLIEATVGRALGGTITARKEGPTFTVHEGGKA